MCHTQTHTRINGKCFGEPPEIFYSRLASLVSSKPGMIAFLPCRDLKIKSAAVWRTYTNGVRILIGLLQTWSGRRASGNPASRSAEARCGKMQEFHAACSQAFLETLPGLAFSQRLPDCMWQRRFRWNPPKGQRIRVDQWRATAGVHTDRNVAVQLFRGLLLISLRRWELVSYHPQIVCLGVRTYDVRTSGPPQMGFQALGARRGLQNFFQPLGDGGCGGRSPPQK
jgi:hypothetical protein